MKHFHFDKIESTNDYTRELLGKYSPVAVSAKYQTNGRGRNQNVWYGEYGKNIYLSIGINHAEYIDAEKASLLQAVGCLAVKKLLSDQILDVRFFIKYPNDVYAEQDGVFKKISGVLTEHSFYGSKCHSSIIGIGVNVNQTVFPDDLSKTATSIKKLGYELSVETLTDKLIEYLEEFLYKDDKYIYDKWLNELNLLNKTILLLEDNSEWIVKELCFDGRLLVKNKVSDEQKFIDNGDSIRYNFY